MGNKNKLHEELLWYGRILKSNTFGTERGVYTIRIIEYRDELYFHKMRDGEVLEVVNLNKLASE